MQMDLAQRCLQSVPTGPNERRNLFETVKVKGGRHLVDLPKSYVRN